MSTPIPRELGDYDFPEALQKIHAIRMRLEQKKHPTQDEKFFMDQILTGVEQIFIAEIRERQARLSRLELKSFEHIAVWGGELSPGCQHCVDVGFAPIRSASDCNLKCKFCYYGDDRRSVRPLGRDQYEISERPVSGRELRLMLTKAAKGSGDLRSVAWVFLEPFMSLEKHPELINFVHELGLYQHMYTNGTLCTRDNLKLLADAGLEEIRFNLAATNCADNVIEAMGHAREFFPYLCIESPMYPEYFESFKKKRAAILDTGVTHIHCAEIHVTPGNIKNYRGQELYQYSRGYISPMSSRRLTYDLMDLAEAEDWQGVAIHDCSNEVKFMRGVSTERLGAIMYEQEMKGLPMSWFDKAIKRYPLTRESKPSA